MTIGIVVYILTVTCGGVEQTNLYQQFLSEDACITEAEQLYVYKNHRRCSVSCDVVNYRDVK